MSVFKKYAGKRIAAGDPNWEKATWYVWRRINGTILHRALKGVFTETEAQETEQQMVRQIAAQTGTKLSARAVQSFMLTTSEPTHVYLLESGGYYKIGRTTNITKRVSELAKTIVPFQTNVVMTILVRDAVGVERVMHQEYAKYRVKGEWFLFDWATLKRVKRRLVVLSEEKEIYNYSSV